MAVLLWCGVGAVAAEWDDEPQVAVEVGARSRVLHRGVDLGGPTAGADLEWKSGRARAQAAWGEAFRSGEIGSGSIGGAYHWELGEGFELAAVATHRRFAVARTGFGRRHSTEAGLALQRSLPTGPVLGLEVRHDVRLRAHYTELRLAGSLALTRLGAFLEWKAFAGWVAADDVLPDAVGPRRSDAYGYAGADFRVPYRVGERLQIVASAGISGTHGASVDWSPRRRADGWRTALGLAVRLDF